MKMNPILRNFLAVLAGLVVGSVVNMGILLGGSSVVPPPAGVDMADMESLKASMHLFQPAHFAAPFLANVFMLPAPAWFVALDLVGAYLPMGWLGWKLAAARS